MVSVLLSNIDYIDIEMINLISVLFNSPNLITIAVMITSCFYLYNLGYRFNKLNRLWDCLPTGLTALPGTWTDSEITVFVECIRLLHAELSTLLGVFSLCYGPTLLVYFTFTFTNTIIDLLFIIGPKDHDIELGFISYVFYLQYIVFTLSIVCTTSWVIEKVCVGNIVVYYYEMSKLD